MINSIASSSCLQFDSVRDQLDQEPGLPFLSLLSSPMVEAACRFIGHQWRDRIYRPWITLVIFLSQVLSAEQCCDEAVDRFQKYRYDQGLPTVSADTSSYCEARKRLPEHSPGGWFSRPDTRSFKGRSSPGSFTDVQSRSPMARLFSCRTPRRTRRLIPSRAARAPGVGFAIARILVIFSLAVGTVLEAAVGPFQGKETSELALLRAVIGEFQPGDIALADRFFCSYWLIAALRARGVDLVVRLHQRRAADFRRGRRLGPNDHIVTWPKPEQRPDWMSPAEYEAMPAELTVREFRVRVQDKTKRVRTMVVVTTLLDPREYRPKELGNLFRQRWHADLDLRTLKTHLHMEMLRTTTPEMVRKEIAMHFLAYNLIRGLMAEAAREQELNPRTLSLMGAAHTVRQFEQTHLYDPTWIKADLPRLLELIGESGCRNVQTAMSHER